MRIHARGIRGAVRAGACIATFTLGNFLATAADPDLERLLQANEASRARVQSAVYTVNVKDEFQSEKGWMQVSGRNNVKRSAKNRWNHAIWERFLGDSKRAEYQNESIAVLNERYSGVQIAPRTPKYVFLHDDIDSGNEHNSWPESENTFDPLPYAFGPALSQTLRESLSFEGALPYIEEYEDPETGDRLTKISLHRDDPQVQGTWLEAEFYLDPSRGHQIAKAVFFNAGGHSWVERTLHYREVVDDRGEKVWFPDELDEVRFGLSSDEVPIQIATRISRMWLEPELTLNAPLDPSNFFASALKIGPPHIETGTMVWNSEGVVFDGRNAKDILNSPDNSLTMSSIESRIADDAILSSHDVPLDGDAIESSNDAQNPVIDDGSAETRWRLDKWSLVAGAFTLVLLSVAYVVGKIRTQLSKEKTKE